MAWTFPPATASAREARRLARERLRELGADGSAPDCLMVVSELVTNAITHGSGPVRLELEAGEGVVRVEVSDAGSSPPRQLPEDPDAVSGRGLRIVEAIAPRWGVRADDRGKTVWADIPL